MRGPHSIDSAALPQQPPGLFQALHDDLYVTDLPTASARGIAWFWTPAHGMVLAPALGMNKCTVFRALKGHGSTMDLHD
jgi:hypothetical protein